MDAPEDYDLSTISFKQRMIMKFNMNKIGSLLIAALAVVSGFSLQSCQDRPTSLNSRAELLQYIMSGQLM